MPICEIASDYLGKNKTPIVGHTQRAWEQNLKIEGKCIILA